MGTKTSYESVLIESTTQEANRYVGIQTRPSLRRIYRLVSTRTGADDPKFREKITLKQNATNPLSAVRNQIIDIPGYKVEVIKVGTYKNLTATDTQLGIQPTIDSSGIPPDLLMAARNEASIGIRGRIRELQQSFSGMTFLGELRETVQMIRHPASAAFKLVERFERKVRPLRPRLKKLSAKKKTSRDERTAGNALASEWLELNFGLAPLIGDIEAIASAGLAVMEEDRVKRVSYRATKKSAKSISFIVKPDYSNFRLGYEDIVETDVTVIYTAGIDRQVESSTNALTNIINAGGFGLDDIVPTVWELLPWSFFLDYFSNIGDVLSANYMSMSNVRWSQETIRMHRTHVIAGQPNVVLPVDAMSYGILGYKPRSCYGIHSRVERAAASIPLSELRFSLPSKRGQFFNLAALAKLVLF